MNKPELPKPGTLLEGQVTHVRDGDTIEVNGIAIRLGFQRWIAPSVVREMVSMQIG